MNTIKVLFLVQGDHRASTYDRLYEAIQNSLHQCDLLWLSSEEQANLNLYFRNIDTKKL